MVDFLVKYEAVKGQIMSFKTSYGIVAAVAAYVFAAAIAQENYAGRLPPGSSRRFAEKFLAPLVARLDGLAARAKPEMSDAEVEAFSDADCPYTEIVGAYCEAMTLEVSESELKVRSHDMRDAGAADLDGVTIKPDGSAVIAIDVN